MIRNSRASLIESAMLTAKLWAELRSKGTTKVGAVVVHEESGGLFFGYNGLPADMPDDNEIWSTGIKHDFVVHAEENAINKAIGALGYPLVGCEIAITMYPCLACCRRIAMSGIKHVYYLDDSADCLSGENSGSRALLLKGCGIQMWRLQNKYTVQIKENV